MALQAVKTVKKAVRRCTSMVIKGAPPQPGEKAQLLLKSHKISASHILETYDVFHFLRAQEEDEEDVEGPLVVDAIRIQTSSAKKLVAERRKWVVRLLARLLEIGECTNNVTWDEYLWIFVRFSSLNRVELSQTLFLLIACEVGSERLHYLTSAQLKDFYSFYDDCPYKAFNTMGIDFDKLPLTRYYASDFAELAQRFGQLLNPALHLQNAIQSHVPSLDFWHNCERPYAFCRKITYDFFQMDTTRVHLRGEPAFRESCDLLLPEALGATPVNTEQWVLRTTACRGGRGLRQVSVWGEQAVPEKLVEIGRKLEEEMVVERAILAEKAAANAVAAAAARRKAGILRGAALQGRGPGSPGGPGSPVGPTRSAQQTTATMEDTTQNTTAIKHGSADGVQAGGPKEAWPELGTNAKYKNCVAKNISDDGILRQDPADYSLYAATLNEVGSVPSEILPPAWMKSATTTPAPQTRFWQDGEIRNNKG